MAYAANRSPLGRVWMVKLLEASKNRIYFAHEHAPGIVMESDPANNQKARDSDGNILDPSWLCLLRIATGRAILIDPANIQSMTPMFAM